MNNVTQASPVKSLPMYLCHKKVCAAKINTIIDHIDDDGKTLFLDNGSIVEIDSAWALRNPSLGCGGYFVEYQEDDKYTSYSPAASFESGYTRTLPDYQQRVVTEKTELDEKLSKLSAFLDSDLFQELHPDEKRRLEAQEAHMSRYSSVLEERIDVFI